MAASLMTATPQLDLHIPPAKMLTMKEDLAVLRSAFAREPGSGILLYRLTSALVQMDHFDEAITLLEPRAGEDYGLLRLLLTALIGREAEESTLQAREVAERGVRAAVSPGQRAGALGELGKTCIRMGELAEAERILREALEENAAAKDSYKRLFRLYLDRAPERALRFAEEWMARGVLHARVLGSVPIALAKMGRFAEAHEAEALDEFLLHKEPAAPAGWDSLADFNSALAEEILNHPDTRYERYGTASAKTWRVDEPALQRSRVFPQLQQLIRREVLAHVEEMPANGHPLLRAQPGTANLRNWCVVTEGEGHETWHMHQNGWMSGVYYIHVQDHIAKGTGPEGCLAFGMSEEFVGDENAAAYGERLVGPQTGLMMMFPSYTFHRTYPHFGPGKRICFAFDVVPAENS